MSSGKTNTRVDAGDIEKGPLDQNVGKSTSDASNASAADQTRRAQHATPENREISSTGSGSRDHGAEHHHISSHDQPEEPPLTDRQFYELIGMSPPERSFQMPKRIAVKGGLYHKIQSHHQHVQRKYRIYDVAAYVFLAMQLMLAAVFIILGSLPKVDPHTTISVLGAVSVVVGGLLSLMKGQGLPHRLRQTRNDLSDVLFEADNLYCDVSAGQDVFYQDIVNLREDYMRVLDKARERQPDALNATAAKIGQTVRKTAPGKGLGVVGIK